MDNFGAKSANFENQFRFNTSNSKFVSKMAIFGSKTLFLIKKTYSFKVLLFSIEIFFDFFDGINFSLNGIRCFCFCVCNLVKFNFGFVQKRDMFVEILFESTQSIERFFDFSLTAADFIFATLPTVDQIGNIDRELLATRIVVTLLLETPFSSTVFLVRALVGFRLFFS